jgi:osmotically-inducible protein OsmY
MSPTITRTLGLGVLLAVFAAAPLAAAQERQPAKPTDAQLKDRIEHRLETSAVVGKYDVKVAVANGVATLTGDVVTAAQKAEAGKVALVTGITKVENNITLDPDEDKTLADRAKGGLTKSGEAITDAWITTKVKWFYLGEDALSGSNINVDTTDRVVTLKGTVKTQAGKARANALAKQTSGVKSVVDQLTIGG